MKTRYFSNTFGVFQGGGVRAAAFAGAYAEAIDAGVKFNAVAGTSAGSIVAALIAAGATPDFLLDELSKTSFGDLLATPRDADRPFEKAALLASLGLAVRGTLRAVSTVLKQGGLHSSVRIEEWMEELLGKALAAQGKAPVARRVTFADLALPIFIVSTDLSAGRPKIWSQSSTPDESVAAAVRCSSSIPFFFQPVRSSGALHVDGGIISNLPSYVFAEAHASAARFSERVLAFQLRSSSKAAGKDYPEFKAFAGSVADAVISGGTAVQLKLQPNVHSIEIDTGAINATDFDKIGKDEQSKLIANGRSAMRAFVANEQLTMSSVSERRTYEGYDERMLVYVHMLQRASRSATFIDRSSYFLFMIFPALLAAARRGITLQLVCDVSSNPDEVKRRGTLRRLGFGILERNEIPFTGLFTDADHDVATAAISSVQGQVGTDFSYETGETRLYTATNDIGVISVLRSSMADFQPTSAVVSTPLRIQTAPLERLFELLRRVPQYASATLDLIDLQIDNKLQSMQTEVKEFKLLQIADLADLFHDEGATLFSPMFAMLRDGSESLITPPVVEQVGDELVLIEGHSRAYYCMNQGIPSMKAVRVTGAKEPLPALPSKFVEARISSRTLPSKKLFTNYVPDRFRRIEELVHQ